MSIPERLRKMAEGECRITGEDLIEAAIEIEATMCVAEKIAKLINELKKREEWWRNNENDAHRISTAVMVALAEVRLAVEAAFKPSID